MHGTNPIILYDGVCGLCNRLVRFMLTQDKRGRLHFASLQSEIAAKILRRHDLNTTDLDTFHFVENYEQPNERVFQRSDAVLRVGRELGGFWAVLAAIAKVLPRAFRDLLYRMIARNRYRIFGKYETCMLPAPNQRSRFLDV
jgi:predicted DCC family thiol-disulfide oxidoreductase YuxK